MMDKLEYLTRQFSRTEKKRFEHYVVTRIWHLLNNLEIKIVTQQYVIRPTGRALTDMYFPQLGIHIEVDETHHLTQIEKDKLRQADIVNATNHEILRVDTSKGIEKMHSMIDEIIIRLNNKIKLPNFKPWDIEAEQNPQTYIEKGFISLSDDVAFKQSYLAASCFGYSFKKFRKGAVKHPKENNKKIWFPKLYKNEGWNNSISDDENIIYEISVKQDQIENHIDKVKKGQRQNRIVFARVKSPLGDIMYRFKGEYELDKNASNYKIGLLWRRVSEQVKTYRN